MQLIFCPRCRSIMLENLSPGRYRCEAFTRAAGSKRCNVTFSVRELSDGERKLAKIQPQVRVPIWIETRKMRGPLIDSVSFLRAEL